MFALKKIAYSTVSYYIYELFSTNKFLPILLQTDYSNFYSLLVPNMNCAVSIFTAIFSCNVVPSTN